MTRSALALLLVVVFGLACAGAGAWVALWWRDRVPTGHKRLLRYVFPYVDDRIGATKTEKVRRANARFRFMRKWWLWWIPRRAREGIADLLWFEPQYGGTTTLPGAKRMARYVTLEFGRPASRRRPYRIWDIQAVVVRPTSEVDVHASFEPSLARWVAWALRLSGPDQLEVEARPELGYWRLARRGPAPEFAPTVPHAVAADA